MENSNATVIPIRRESAKSAEKKREIALSAISSLAELGYARMNLRDVAQRSGFSLGVIHYYFSSKTDLLIYCIRIYKEDFIDSLKDLITHASQLKTLTITVADFLANTIAEHAHIHRLWYDMRAQALFDPAFQEPVEEMEQGLIDVFRVLFTKLHELKISSGDNDPLELYLALDGWFRYFLQRQLMGETDAVEALKQRVLIAFDRLLGTP